MNKFKWCFIGTGSLAAHVADLILASGRHEIVSVYTRSYEKGKAFAEKYGCTAYPDADQAMRAPGVQAVYVVTPHNSHYLYMMAALEAGKPVLCEKPFTTDARQAQAVIDLSKEKGIYVAEAMWTWFSPVAFRVKQWLDEGICGDIEKIDMTYHANVLHYAPRLTDPALAGGALLDSGVYPLTYLYRLFGRPVALKCAGVIENGVDLEEDVSLTFPGGRTCDVSISMHDDEGGQNLYITGAKGRILVEGFRDAAQTVFEDQDGQRTVFAGETTYVNEFDLVAGEILDGRTESEYVPLQATLDVMEIMDECRAQMGLVYPFEKR